MRTLLALRDAVQGSTPADAEIEHEDHYQDFLATTRFLLGDDDARVEELKQQLSGFGAALTRAAGGEPDQVERVERAKRAVEDSLRDVMARTERGRGQ